MDKLLLITNLFPYKSNMTGGIFITKRLEILQKYMPCYVFCTPVFRMSKLARVALNFSKRNGYKLDEPLEFKGVQNGSVVVNIDIRSLILDHIFPEHMAIHEKKVAQFITQNLRETSAHLIVAHGMYNVAAGNVAMILSEKLNVPYIVTLHGNDVNMAMRKRIRSYLRTLENASKCIFVSNALLKKAQSYGYSGKNAVVIPNGYDPALFFPIDKEEVRADLSIYKPNNTYVGYVGNLVPVKRVEKLSIIFHEVAQRVNNCTFIVVGDGPLRERVQRETRDLDILFTDVFIKMK